MSLEKNEIKFPIRVGIIFIEDHVSLDNPSISFLFNNTIKKSIINDLIKYFNAFKNKFKKDQSFDKLIDNYSTKPRLNFDQAACAYLILQLNSVQSIFDFCIINC